MADIKNIININDHPIDSLKYQKKCNKNLRKDSILILRDFLKNKSLTHIQNEATNLEAKAYYCSQKHTVLLNQYNKNFSKKNPLNIEVTSDKGCVPHDLINKESHLNKLYSSSKFKNFIINVLGVKNIYPYKDKLSSINLNYYQYNQQLGWHFDNASFAITLMIQSPKKGGIFQYISKGRNYKKNYINKNLIHKVLQNKINYKKLFVDPGTLILFYGRDYLHRVTPVKSKKPRILVTLNYNEEKNIELSVNARKTFFGRTN